jgi:CelD/BcsL family acetyltransferase involved in cellulose biosynthesis
VDKKLIACEKLALRERQADDGSTSLPVVIELLPYSELDEAARRWQALEQHTNNTGLTNSWTWTQTWLEHHGHVVRPSFAFGRRGDEIIGAVLVVTAVYKRKKMRHIPITRVHLGTGKYVEYNRLLVAPGCLNAFATALIKTLQHHYRWSELHFDGFVPADAIALIHAGRNAGLRFDVEVKRTPIFAFQKAIDDGHQDVISSLGKNTRYNLRRSMRLFEESYGPLTIEWAETAEQAKDILQELIALHQKRWTRLRRTGAFDKPHLRAYYVGLIDAFKLWSQGGSVIVCRVKAGETTLGCVFYYVERGGHLMFTKSGIHEFEDAKLKPAFVTHLVCMEECKKRSLIEGEGSHGRPAIVQYDFLAGDESYKESLTNTEGRLLSATAERGPLMWLIGLARLVRSLLKKS